MKFNIEIINEFIKIERKIFRNIFLGEYSEALTNIDYLNNNVSFSQWSILMKMTIYYLKGDEESLTEYTNNLLENKIESQTIRETIFLHYKKLTKDITEKKDFNVLISDLEFQLNTRESIFIREYTKETYEKEIYHQLLSVEKYATSPFNRKTQNETIKYLITLSYEYSIVDLYKTFSMIISELQTESYELNKNILNEIYELFPKTNLVKINSENQVHYNVHTRKLFYTYELYLSGEFKRVMKISKKHLIKYPYDIDYLYFLINSATYLEINPLDSFTNLSNNSLLYKIIFNYYNLINNVNPDESLSKIKKILIIFGVQTQWSMYLYSLLFKFLCLHRDTKEASFSRSLYYSYQFHPRFFYNLNLEGKRILIDKLKSYNYFVNSNTMKLYELEISKDIKYNLTLKPDYRSDYIYSLYDKNINNLEKLYDNDKIKFNTKVKIIIDYINLLFDDNKRKALILMTECMFNYKIPLCMFNYKSIINNFDESLFDSPLYVYIFILHNPLDKVKINFVMSKYLYSVNTKYSLPSRLAENIDKDNEYVEILFIILDFISKDIHLEEFVLDIKNSKELIEEQLKILNSLKTLTTDSKKKKGLEIDIEKLSIKKLILNSKNFMNRNKLRLNIDYLKDNLLSSIAHPSDFESLPLTTEKNLIKLITNPESIYYPKGDSKETLLVSDLEKAIKGFLYSEYGLLNEIEANIRHGFAEQRLLEVFFSEKLLSSKVNKKYIKNINWQHKDELQEFLFNFTDDVTRLIDDFKDKNLSSNKKESKNILDFSNATIYSKINLNEMLKRIEFLDDKFSYCEYLSETIYTIIDNLLLKYREKIIEVLNEELIKLIKKNLKILESIKDINKEPVNDAFNRLDSKLYEAVTDIASWFELYDDIIHEPFLINEILDSNSFKKMNIGYKLHGISIPPFKGKCYQQIYNIIFNTMYNVKKHTSEKIINIDISKSVDSVVQIKFDNKFENVTCNGRKGQGHDIIKKSLSIINEVTIDKIEDYFKIEISDNRYIVIIKLLEKVFHV